jgi:RNA polymerase sigma factor for flagellar operon FliA
LDRNSDEDTGRNLLKFLSDEEERWPSLIVERMALQLLLAKAIETIPHTEQTVLKMYYDEDLTLREIARVISLHESRISQIKSQAILRLRNYMQKRWPLQKRA